MRDLFSYIRILLLFFLLGQGHLLTAQTEVSDYHPGITAEGITYFLPMTALRIVVQAHCTHYKPGLYAAYSERFLDQKVDLQPMDLWTLSEIQITPYGIPDRNKAYTIRLDHRTSAPLVSLSPNGLLLSINAEPRSLSVLPEPSIEKSTEAEIDIKSFATPAMLRANSEITRAELAAQEIYDIRENRSQLIKGQADFNPKDGAQLQTMLSHLDKREKALNSLFLGTTIKEKHTVVYDYVPKLSEVEHPLFRFSKYMGFLDTADVVGVPVVVYVEAKPVIDENDMGSTKKKNTHDLRYRVPGEALVRIQQGQQIWVKDVLPVAQFGRVEHLGGILFDKKFNTRVWLSAVTGNIEKIDIDKKQ